MAVRADNQAIQAGHVTVGSFTSNHIIRNFPIQTNQVVEWTPPVLNDDAFPDVAAYEVSLSGRKYPNGFYQFSWIFGLWTTTQYDYWMDTFMAGGVNWSNVTVRAYTKRDDPIYLQCIMHENQSVSPIRGASLQNVRFDFVHGVIIT